MRCNSIDEQEITRIVKLPVISFLWSNDVRHPALHQMDVRINK